MKIADFLTAGVNVSSYSAGISADIYRSRYYSQMQVLLRHLAN